MDFADKQTENEKGYYPQDVKIVVRAKCFTAFSLTPTLQLEGNILFHFLFVGSPKSFYWLLKKKWLKIQENLDIIITLP